MVRSNFLANKGEEVGRKDLISNSVSTFIRHSRIVEKIRVLKEVAKENESAKERLKDIITEVQRTEQF